MHKGAQIDFEIANNQARALSKVISQKEAQLISILMRYETHKTAVDEIVRTHDLLMNLDENSEYFVEKVDAVAVFMPSNQPLYAFACFAAIPALMSQRVHIKTPETMRTFYPDMLEVLEIDKILSNIEHAKDSREEFVNRCTATKINYETNERDPVVDVVIFTGSTKNADILRKRFHQKTLFITNGSGHNPLVITETANLDKAVESVVRVRTYNQGQDCAAPNTILVHKDVYDGLLTKLRERVKLLTVGDYSSLETDIGPISRHETLPLIEEFLVKNSQYIDETTEGIIRAKTHIVEPTIINKPLVQGGNFTELFAPIFVLQRYDQDSELAIYFEHEKYQDNAMYITVYGRSNYLEHFINKPGKMIHDNSTVLYDTDLHAPGIERGVKAYGGYGRGASCISINGRIVSCPTLPQRDIYDYIVCRKGRWKKMEQSKLTHNQQLAKNEVVSEGKHWGEKLAERVIEQFPEQEIYTCAAGISPSGIVHFGNFRDLFTAYVVSESLKRKGKKARLIFSWDDFDRFRKVPRNVDQSFTQYLGLPYTEVPCPDGKYSSYAERFEKEFEKSIQAMGIKVEYLYQSQLYKSGAYDDLIIHSLQHREKIAEILLSFMPEKTRIAKSIEPEEYKAHYYPVILYSRFTGRDNTRIISYDGGKTLTYKCFDTDQTDTIDITKDRIVKLSWKIDWPMRWKKEGVVFEPGGHDHASPGGSYDTSSRIAREVFSISPPAFEEYKFVGLQGLGSKMSGSKGNVISPRELLDIYSPEILKWLYASKPPGQTFELSFGKEIFRQYSDFDRSLERLRDGSSDKAERITLAISGIRVPKQLSPIPFRQLLGFGQIVQWDEEKLKTILKDQDLIYDPESITSRIPRAKAWLERYNKSEAIKILDKPNIEYMRSMSKEQIDQVTKLYDVLTKSKDMSISELETIVYAIPKKPGDTSKQHVTTQRAFFKDVYNLLIGEDTGPRLSTFLWAANRDKVLKGLNTLSDEQG